MFNIISKWISPGTQGEKRLIGSTFFPVLNSLPAEIQIAMPFMQANSSHQLRSLFTIVIPLELSQIDKASCLSIK